LPLVGQANSAAEPLEGFAVHLAQLYREK